MGVLDTECEREQLCHWSHFLSFWHGSTQTTAIASQNAAVASGSSTEHGA